MDTNNSESIDIILKQIRDNGIIYVSHDRISVLYQFSNKQSEYFNDVTNYERLITCDELYSIDSTINLLKSLEIDEENLQLYTDFQDCFKKALELQKRIQILHNFGKTFVYDNHLFYNLCNEAKNILISIDILISMYQSRFNTFLSDNINHPEYPPFLTRNNLLYFGSLLQAREKRKIIYLLQKMFFIRNFDDVFDCSYEEACNEEYIIDPIKSAIQLFSTIYTKLSYYNKYPKKKETKVNHSLLDNKFIKLQDYLFQYFINHNFLVIKVDKPVETFHVLKLISFLLHNSYFQNTYFYQNFYCYEDSDINSYFLAFENEKYFLQSEYSFIVHPEFLSVSNQTILKEKLVSRMTINPDMSLQKFVIITSSPDFIFGEKPDDDILGQIFTIGETSIKVDSNIFREYLYKNDQFYFHPQIRQSRCAGDGKSSLIEKEIEELKKNKDYEFKVFHHFIENGNQPVPIESFSSNQMLKSIIHIQCSDDIMEKGIKFWSYMFQLFIGGFILPPNGEPMLINSIDCNLVFFEIPQIKKGSLPLENLSDFPIPISSLFPMSSYEFFSQYYPHPVSISDTLIRNNDDFKEDAVLLKSMELVVHRLRIYSGSDNFREYIQLMYRIIFNIDEGSNDFMLNLSYRKLGYIEKYLIEYTKLFIDSISSFENNINLDQLTAFFYLLTVSSFYEYDCLPKNTNHSLTFLTVNDLFNDQIERKQKKIYFYTTRSLDEIFGPLRDFNFTIQDKYFSICYNYTGQDPLAKDVLRTIFCSSISYDIEIVQPFINKNPQSYISRMQITIPVLFRLSVILNRIYLTQPIILSGDTGCGKSSYINLLSEYFNLPINNEMNFLNTEICKSLYCNGEITKDDIDNHLKNSPIGARKQVLFFDKLNTSPASSYIEHLILRENVINGSNFVFIGAMNPFKVKNPIASILANVGLSLPIVKDKNEINLIENMTNNSNELFIMDDLMYHVYRSQEATKDVIFDCNPICYEDRSRYSVIPQEDDVFYPKEEREVIHLIIDNAAQHGRRESTLQKLKDSVDICILFIRKLMNERAVISYRDIERAITIYNKLYEFYNYILKSGMDRNIKEDIIPTITVIISFVLRLPNSIEFEERNLNTRYQRCSEIFNNVFYYYFVERGERKYGKFENGKYQINSRDQLLSFLNPNVEKTMKDFMRFVYRYTIDYLKKESIWKFQSTFIHIFIMDICIKCKLPCFIIGMPGTSKSYPVELLKNHYGKDLFVGKYLASKESPIDGIKSKYYDASFFDMLNYQNEIPDKYSVVFIKNIGKLNIKSTFPLNSLHEILDYGLELNEAGIKHKVTTIGVSNYTMDLASMNRGLLVYAGLPNLAEILTTFAINLDRNQEANTESASYFIDYRKYVDKEKVKRIFKYLWPVKMPKTIALRSIYNMQSLLINQTNFDPNSVCRILRELTNSNRLIEEGNYRDLMSECPENVKSLEFNKIDNIACFLERIASSSTKSNKSLSLFTKNYEAIEYFELFEDHGFIKFLQEQYLVNGDYLFNFDKDGFSSFKYQLFAEDFKKGAEEISQDALKKIIECITTNDKNVLFIGNHPCVDSCLDLLNVPHSKDLLEREVTLGSGFSSKFKLTNTDFFIMMIANIEDLQNITRSENPFSIAFLDRTETVYLDWEMIAPYYLRYKFKDLDEYKSIILCKDISEKLNKHANYETTEPELFHSSIQTLYDYSKGDIKLNNKYLSKLIKERFSNGVKSVILTKSKILEDIYLPTKFKENSVLKGNSVLKENLVLLENDSNIDDFSHLKESIDKLNRTEGNTPNSDEKLIVIKCSTFDKLHFVHLKTFFDQIADPSLTDIKYNIFIIYYGCDPKDFEGLSTFRWPIIAMEDISIHKELETKITIEEEENETNQLHNSVVQLMIKKLNNMNTDLSDIFLDDELTPYKIGIKSSLSKYVNESVEEIIVKCKRFRNSEILIEKTKDAINDILKQCKDNDIINILSKPIDERIRKKAIDSDKNSKEIEIDFRDIDNDLKNSITENEDEFVIIAIIKSLDRDIRENKCYTLFKNLFNNMVNFIEKEVNEKIKYMYEKNFVDIKANYESSEFRNKCDFFEQIKQIFDSDNNYKYFDIKIDTNNNILSTKSQLITQVYQKLHDMFQLFFLFGFGSPYLKSKGYRSDIGDFLLKCKYLNLPFENFLNNPVYDVIHCLFKDFFEFLITNKASFDNDMLKRKCIADRFLCAIGDPNEVKKLIVYLLDIPLHDAIFSYLFGQIPELYNSETIYLQQYVDFLHFRSFAGLDITKHQSNDYWDKYINFCLLRVKEDATENNNDPESDETSEFSRLSMIKSIGRYRNKSIFDIFTSPIIIDESTFEDYICQKLISTKDFMTKLENDEVYHIYKEFNEANESLKSQNVVNKITIKNENRFTVLSMLMFYALSKWNSDKPNELLSNFGPINNVKTADLDLQIINLDKIKKIDLNLPKFNIFGKCWTNQYKNLDWNFKGDCLIDEIQSILFTGNSVKPEFRKWLFSGFDTDEPLSIIAFRRFLTSQTEYKDDLAKVLDPYFGNPRIVDLFIEYIADKIPEKDSFPIGNILKNDNEVMYFLHSSNVFKIVSNDKLCKLRSAKPYLAQFVWFHIAFNKPSKYPMTTLLIKESSFFIDFQVVPKIINSIVHLRHIFSYNPVFIPIILHCTSLFDDCECKLLLYSLGYFDTPNKDFENLQKEVNSFKEFLKQNYSDSYDYLLKHSAYDQIKFILKIYYKKYNKIIKQISEIANKATDIVNELLTINAYDVFPNMLITNLTLGNLLMPILYKKNLARYIEGEFEICQIFNTNCFKSLIEGDYTKVSFSLFTVSLNTEFNNESEKDFIGFSKKEYECLFQNYLKIDKNPQIVKLEGENVPLNFHASILSFLLHLYLNKSDDDCSNYWEMRNNVNDISNVHLNTYANVGGEKIINYDLVINQRGVNLNNENLNNDMEINIFYQENVMYPLQGIFKLLPKKLRDEIRNYQRNGFYIIKSEEDLLIKDEAPMIIEEEEDPMIIEEENEVPSD